LKALREKSDPNISLFGIDPSLDMLEIAKNKTKESGINFKQSYGDELPFIDNQFDWIISILAMHHIPNEQKGNVVREIKRVLKPNGKVLISDLGRPKNFAGKILAWFSKNHSHTKGNMETMEKLMIKNGFKIIGKNWSWFFIEHISFKLIQD
jgi:ubiquinone/menaquinone biosynthesis C-methylase UbiE